MAVVIWCCFCYEPKPNDLWFKVPIPAQNLSRLILTNRVLLPNSGLSFQPEGAYTLTETTLPSHDCLTLLSALIDHLYF